MSDRKEIDKAVARYLEDVAAQLGNLPPDEKESILAELESHVYAALEKIGPDPTLEDLNLVLSTSFFLRFRTPSRARRRVRASPTPPVTLRRRRRLCRPFRRRMGRSPVARRQLLRRHAGFR